jgi:hypothetical protein
MKREIQIDITADGKIVLEGSGFAGKDCDKKMAEFEQELGSAEGRTNKPEYHRTVSTQQKVGGA